MKILYHGLWARKYLSRLLFKAILGILHIVDPHSEDDTDRLRKLGPFLQNFKLQCQTFYQPLQNVAVDERLVKSKHRSGIRQFIANKPVKFGIELWVLVNSKTGYTFDFDVYIGTTEQKSQHGLGYDVVMKLAQPLINQGYHVFFENFYISKQLVNDLFILNTPSCGTVAENRKGFLGKALTKGK